ncbi:uncharacterized protein GGS25DRAFT_59769 [Hypoxylon fragiforme]|uniref:uncharacterized protein n=1 Tax=Hypoxylon fragiforme TaxID=63214 RepID=UPI0020C5FC27|nr:uncharacterized protein GGS25DRAFT_59769 [Hypoxylon fragiforme]KAI2614648.1 hypothetical protein GGS25DRAFT_59769 [Hypoxylon fragiforme]
MYDWIYSTCTTIKCSGFRVFMVSGLHTVCACSVVLLLLGSPTLAHFHTIGKSDWEANDCLMYKCERSRANGLG